MRRNITLKVVCAILLTISLIFTINTTVIEAAGSAGFTLSASAGTVREGDTVTITGNVSTGSAIATFDLDVIYDAAKLQYQGASAAGKISAGELDIGSGSGRVQFLYLDDGGGTSGISGGSIFQLKFKVTGGKVGETIGLSYAIRTVGDSQAQAMSSSGAGVNLKIAAPLSKNNNLAALAASPGSLSPAFSANTLNYHMSVPFSVERISLKATAEDDKAAVNISSPALAPGAITNLSVTVEAENGAQKIYKIAVNREQDPNYVPDSNNDLSVLSIEGFLLSPQFSPKQKEYIVYLPYEVELLEVNAAAASEKAKQIEISGQNNLKAGQLNIIEVAVAAEDDSIQNYRIAAYRAPEFTDIAGIVLPVARDEAETETPEEGPETEITSAESTESERITTETTAADEMQSQLSPAGWLIPVILILLVLSLAALTVVLYLYMKLRHKSTFEESD